MEHLKKSGFEVKQSKDVTLSKVQKTILAPTKTSGFCLKIIFRKSRLKSTTERKAKNSSIISLITWRKARAKSSFSRIVILSKNWGEIRSKLADAIANPFLSRATVGPTDPEEAKKVAEESIRANFAKSILENGSELINSSFIKISSDSHTLFDRKSRHVLRTLTELKLLFVFPAPRYCISILCSTYIFLSKQ